MRELTIRIRFVSPCLGNVAGRGKDGGKFFLPRSPAGQVIFMPSWHGSNMRFASELVGKNQDEVKKVLWDLNVDGVVSADKYFRHYVDGRGKKRYTIHEAFHPGQVVGINCVCPATILDGDLWRLMTVAGQYKGLSPWNPGSFGFFEVDKILLRRRPVPDGDEVESELKTGG